jgi:serine phosphatase RsbU (regulator of sigma subunit)
MTYSNLFSIAYFALGIIILFLGLVIFRENPKGKLNRIASLMLFFASLNPILGALGLSLQSQAKVGGIQLTATVYFNLFYVWELFFPFLILFALAFPEPKPILKKRGWRWPYLLFLPHLFHIVLVLLFSQPAIPKKLSSLFSGQSASEAAKLFLEPLAVGLRLVVTLFGAMYSVHLKFFSVVNFSYIVIALLLLHQSYRLAAQPRLRAQLQVILTGLAISLGLYSAAFLIPSLTPWEVIEPVRYGLAVLALVVGAGAIGWAIIRHHFLDIKSIVRQSLAYSITSALLIGVYLLLVSKFSSMLAKLLGKQVPFLEIGFIILALIFFQPVLGQVDEFVRRIIVRDRTDYRQVLEDYSRQIISVFDLEKLNSITRQTLSTHLGVEEAVLLTREDSGQKWRLQDKSDSSLITVGEDQLLSALADRNNPLFVDDLKEESGLSQMLKEKGVYLLIPLVDQDQLTGVLGLGKKQSGFGFSYEDIAFLKVLANQLVVAKSNAHLYQQALEKQRLEEELALARQVQLEFLPQTLPQHPKIEIACFMQLSRQVGGDYYDFLWNKKGNLGLVIADSVGKGMPAALLVSLIHSGLRAEIKNSESPSLMLTSLNQLLCGSTRSGHFATLFYGEFLADKMELLYCNAGHNYPLLVRSDGSQVGLITGGLILGAFPEATYQEEIVSLRSQDVLVMYTDGLSEAQNPAEEEFGEKRILEVICQNRHLSAEAIKDKLMAKVSQHTSEFQDDLSLVVAKVL